MLMATTLIANTRLVRLDGWLADDYNLCGYSFDPAKDSTEMQFRAEVLSCLGNLGELNGRFSVFDCASCTSPTASRGST